MVPVIALCLLLKVVQSAAERRPVRVADAFWKSDDVAMTVGTPAAPVPFAQSELAAMEANEMDELVPPI